MIFYNCYKMHVDWLWTMEHPCDGCMHECFHIGCEGKMDGLKHVFLKFYSEIIKD